MDSKYTPDDFTLMEATCVNWVLGRIKEDILNGMPAETAIDNAIDELRERFGN